MTFDASETSRTLGEPYQLFKFTSGSVTYAYTTADHIIVNQALPYLPNNPMESVEVVESTENSKGKLNFEVMRDHELAALFLISVPRTISLTIYAGHESDVTDEIITIWTGRVVGCEWKEDDKATISCESITTVLQRLGLPYKFGETCQHTLYRGGCQLDIFDNSTLETVDSINGFDLVISNIIGFPDNEYPAGLVVFNDQDYRMITGYDTLTGTLTLIRPFEGLSALDTVRVAKGCDRSSSRCEELDNFEHFLGFETIPTRNPFEGLVQKALPINNKRALALGFLQ